MASASGDFGHCRGIVGLLDVVNIGEGFSLPTQIRRNVFERLILANIFEDWMM